MRELGVEGLSEDQRFLIVLDPGTGERLLIPLGTDSADAQLRLEDVVKSSDVSHAATVSEQPMVTQLSPREIQTRVRRGESPEAIATATGMSATTIDAFAGPVLDERAHMARQAGSTSVRRKHVTGTGVRLDELVNQTLRSQGHPVDDISWDAFRREDGKWTVIVTPSHSDDTATFLYDVEARYVVPVDQTAHDLVADIPAAVAERPSEMALADAVRDDRPTREPSPEPAVEPDFELPEFEDSAPREPHQHALELDLGIPADIAAAESLLEAESVYPAVSSLKEARDRRAQHSAALDAEAVVAQDVIDAQRLDDIIEHEAAVPESPHDKPKRHERRHVPSWDEIMFGGRSD